MGSQEERLLGHILLKQRVITKEDLERCLKIQSEEKKQGKKRSLGEILLAEGLLSSEEIERALEAQRKALQFQEKYSLGLLALRCGWIQKQDLEECVKELRKNPEEDIGQIFLRKGLLTEEQLQKLVSMQKSQRQRVPLSRFSDPGKTTMLIGEVALEKGLISKEQLNLCLERYMQAKSANQKKSFFSILEDFLSPEDLEDLKQEIMISSPRPDLIANYRILGKIGMGAMGVVYKALDPLGRTVALKVLLPKYSNDSKFYRRFMREGFIATTLDHPNIVKAYEVGISGEFVYFSMEYVEGKTVGQLIKERDSLPPRFALFIVGEVAKALECAEKNKLVHRDIKPDNIIITKEGQVKLCDLGIAKEIHSQRPDFTPTDRILGTPFYVSPELVKGEENIDIRSDIYSLGASLYHMIVGEVPFDGDSAARIMVRHVLERPLPPKQRRPWIPKEVSDLVMQMMEKDLSKRIQTPTEVYQRVVSLLNQLKE